MNWTKHIETEQDAREFFDALLVAGVNFHPDTPFNDYVQYDSGERVFSDEEADRLDGYMGQCFEACADVYAVAVAAFDAFVAARP